MSASLTAATHRLNVKKLYKNILRLHRGLPIDMRSLGDHYVRDEFRRNKKAGTVDHVQRFMLEWTDYAVNLSKQLNNKAMVDSVKIGKELPLDKLEAFSEEQLRQLFSLKEEVENPKAFTPQRKISDKTKR